MKVRREGSSRRSRKSRYPGFTIVELLIVIVVIAILAAISIVAYTGIQNRANDSAVQSDLRNIANKLELYHSDMMSYPINAGQLQNAGLSFSKNSYTTVGNNVVYCRNGDGTGYRLVVRSKSGALFFVGNGQATAHYTASWGSQAVICSANGVGAGFSHLSPSSWGYDSGAWAAWTG